MLQLDIAVLQYQNQKLLQKLETQKLEYAALENKLSQLNESQHSYDSALTVVKKSWEQVIASQFIFVSFCNIIWLHYFFILLLICPNDIWGIVYVLCIDG